MGHGTGLLRRRARGVAGRLLRQLPPRSAQAASAPIVSRCGARAECGDMKRPTRPHQLCWSAAYRLINFTAKVAGLAPETNRRSKCRFITHISDSRRTSDDADETYFTRDPTWSWTTRASTSQGVCAKTPRTEPRSRARSGPGIVGVRRCRKKRSPEIWLQVVERVVDSPVHRFLVNVALY